MRRNEWGSKLYLNNVSQQFIGILIFRLHSLKLAPETQAESLKLEVGVLKVIYRKKLGDICGFGKIL